MIGERSACLTALLVFQRYGLWDHEGPMNEDSSTEPCDDEEKEGASKSKTGEEKDTAEETVTGSSTSLLEETPQVSAD